MFNLFQIFTQLTGKKIANDINIMTVNDYYDRLKIIALTLFEWDGLPDSCNTRALEETLFTYGRALFIKDDSMGFLNMKCVPSGQLNVYDEPVSYNAYSAVYPTKTYVRDNCVLIRNNYIERPTDISVILFANRLTEAERTIDVNIKAQKTPTLLKCDDKDRLTVENIYKKYDGNEPVIIGGKGFNTDALSVLKTDAPFVADKLQQYKHEIWNEALTFFGINNANSDKRERLVTDEVNANNEVIEINAEAMLLTRKEACEQINKMYGLNVSVKMRDLIKKATPSTSQTNDGGEK